MQELIASSGFFDAKLLIEAAREQSYFELRKKNFLFNYNLAPDKKLYLKAEIEQIEKEFISNYYKDAGILNGKHGNSLVKWGFKIIFENPSILICEAKNQLMNCTESDILLRFSVSKKNATFLHGLSLNYSNKKIHELNETEYWVEALHYILYGVNGAEYLMFLKNKPSQIEQKVLLTERDNRNIPQQQSESYKCEDENDFLSSTIENKLEPFKQEFNKEQDYNKAVKLLKSFFLNDEIIISNPFFVKSRNVRNMAFALGEIWRTQKNEPINYEYLKLYTQLFSIFKNHIVEKTNIFGCSLYKYSISKT